MFAPILHRGADRRLGNPVPFRESRESGISSRAGSAPRLAHSAIQLALYNVTQVVSIIEKPSFEVRSVSENPDKSGPVPILSGRPGKKLGL